MMSKLLLSVAFIVISSVVSLSDGYTSLHRRHQNSGHHGQSRHQRHAKYQAHAVQEPKSWSPSEVLLETGALSTTLAPEDRVFVSENASLVRAHIGSTAILHCEVKKDSQFGMITWVRLEDANRPYTLLTIGDSNYVEDKRYVVAKPQKHLSTDSLDWALQIQRVTREDAGRYECQATTHPPQAIVFRLKVVEAFSQILGTKQKIIKRGSTLQLHCILKRATEQPLYIFWYHNDRMINYDTERGVRVTNDASGSTLTLTGALPGDSGNYTCSPYNIRPASVMVHVSTTGDGGKSAQAAVSIDEKPPPPSAAVQSDAAVAASAAEATSYLRLCWSIALILASSQFLIE